MLRQGSYPIWDSQDGYFQPFKIKSTPLYEEINDVISSMALPVSSSLYMRGSIIEEVAPHPKSDVDIILIGDAKQNAAIKNCINDTLQYLGRPIELRLLTMDIINKTPALRLLLHTRATHISGKKIMFAHVAADFETMRSHYYTHKVFMLNDILTGDEQQRVFSLKQISRSYGILNFLLNGLFSRDIYTCVDWAKNIHSRAGKELEEYWNLLDANDNFPPMDIRHIKRKLLDALDIAAKNYKKKNGF